MGPWVSRSVAALGITVRYRPALPVCLSACLPVCLSACLPVCLSAVCLSASLPENTNTPGPESGGVSDRRWIGWSFSGVQAACSVGTC